MLQFAPNGYLTPDNVIQTDLSEFENCFVSKISSTNRKKLLANFLDFNFEFLQEFKLQELKLWVNGSFTTLKPNPKDIDLLIFVDFEFYQKFEAEIKGIFSKEKMQKDFGLDIYYLEIFPENHPKRAFTLSDFAYWKNQFSKTRPDRKGKIFKKGFVELLISPHEISKIRNNSSQLVG